MIRGRILNLLGKRPVGTDIIVMRLSGYKESNGKRVGMVDVRCLNCKREFRTVGSQVAGGKVKRCKRCARRLLASLGTKAANNRGEKNGQWKGGKTRHSGYILVRVIGKGYVPEHRLIMENFLGRTLAKNEEVHHKNGIRDDNRLENLELWQTSQPKGRRKVDMFTEWLNLTRELFPETEKFLRIKFPTRFLEYESKLKSVPV